MLEVTAAAVRVSKGLVLWVVSGVQRKNCYWPGCEGLCWEWWKRGNQLWRPCIWWKVDENDGGTGIPGSGGKQWLRNDWEYVLAFKKEGWLPWASNCAMGHEPVIDQVGGAMSNRTVDGQRINQKAGREGKPSKTRWGGSTRKANREMAAGSKDGARQKSMDVTAGHDTEGNLKANGSRPMPKIANPGNVLADLGGIVKARVGGGHMGSKLCHLSEAPFPEKLAEFFIRSFCPPDGVCADCFSGSGTTGAVAVEWQRRFLGCDLRESQVELSRKRIGDVTPIMFDEVVGKTTGGGQCEGQAEGRGTDMCCPVCLCPAEFCEFQGERHDD